MCTTKTKSRSPMVQAKRFSRLLQFQQQRCEEPGLPSSRLQEGSSIKQVRPPSSPPPSSPPSSPPLRRSQDQEGGEDGQGQGGTVGLQSYGEDPSPNGPHLQGVSTTRKCWKLKKCDNLFEVIDIVYHVFLGGFYPPPLPS